MERLEVENVVVAVGCVIACGSTSSFAGEHGTEVVVQGAGRLPHAARHLRSPVFGRLEWLRANASTYRVDVNAISANGYPAGAVTSLLLAYLPSDAGLVENPARVAAALPVAGAIPTLYVQPGEPPTFMTHGTADPTVPYSDGTDTCDAIIAAGIVCDLNTLDGATHQLGPYRAQIVEAESAFLFREVLEPLGYTTEISPVAVTTTTALSTTTTTTTIVSTSSTTSAPSTTVAPATTTVTSEAAPASAVRATPAFTG